MKYSKGKNDECYTPACGVEPILEYIPEGKIVWCPFDTKESQFVELISKHNQVVYSHIDTGQDFFEYEPEHWDIIISNPPFTNKRKFFERALSFEKPFAMLMTAVWLNDSAPKKIFRDKEFELLMFTKRLKYIMPEGQDNSKITFSSFYYCHKFLPKQIIIKDLNQQ